MSDLIRIITDPTTSVQVVPLVRQAIQQSWPLGIQNEGMYKEIFEFKCKGNPWEGQGESAVYGKLLVVALIRNFAQKGWKLIAGCDISKKRFDVDSLFFEKTLPDPLAAVFAISFNKTDRIRIIGGDPQLIAHFQHIITSGWPSGIQAQRDYAGSLELKLKGVPWYATGYGVVEKNKFLVHILQSFKSLGYGLNASIDLTRYTSDFVSEVDCWIFRGLNEVYRS